ncbi:MAG: hypothetical protein ABIS50_21690 [Luteolibacter sp.]|uniref:hypothetical protein n=1 Tax=Luteolibacter sp. TaxID=1962973 RepID=UPI00326636D9
MSRRSRRRKAAGEGRWAGKAAVALLVVGVVFLGTVYAVVRSYLHSDGFRKFLSVEASDMAGVTGEFGSFHWDGLAVDTDSFEATGDGLVTGVRADGLHTEVGLGGLKRGVWEVRGSRVRRLEVSLDATKRPDETAAAKVDQKMKSSVAKTKRPSWLPSEAELESMDVGDVSVKVILDQGLATATGMNVHAEQAGAKNAYRGEIDGGTVRLPFGIVPELRLDRVQLRYQDGRAFLTSATVGAWKNGRIESTGEWDMKSRQYSLEGNATGIHCDDLLGSDWAKRLTGDVTSDFAMSNSTGAPVASGKIIVKNGTLTALPMLDALAAYADTRRFRMLTLNEAHTAWRWKKGELSLTDLVLSSEGLVRLEGSMIIRGNQMDGVFRLGLAPGTLASIPGAETDVFIAGERGLLWTPLRITGTLDDPKEDLTDRLIAAAGVRMFDQIPETGEKVIKFTKSVLGESPNKAIEKGVERGVEIIDKGGKAVRRVSGILDGILGSETEPDKEDP